ncbi:DUF2505 family protein [Corynebacterium heidelbergense]|uniref:DUF2505 domain-containing protein n=1 Tax=Corynebacterium heidelbergense TaxID=2055947 RepID=A0A364V809_9CORY|nr:DUF2505 family protein [Corynebacterium heidelbergense]RAV32767.1 hypothetical protein DLJ54_01675 [Corynebacterium heidelbergense]
MAKTKRFTLQTNLPIERVYSVVSGDTYLLTMEGSKDEESTEILYAQREDRPDGTVCAEVHGAPFQDEEDGEGDGDGAGADSTERAVIRQITQVTPLTEQGFGVHSSAGLPQDMGTMTSVLAYRPIEDGTQVDVEFTADVSVPLVGGMIEKTFLSEVEETVGRGMRRIEFLDARS